MPDAGSALPMRPVWLRDEATSCIPCGSALDGADRRRGRFLGRPFAAAYPVIHDGNRDFMPLRNFCPSDAGRLHSHDAPIPVLRLPSGPCAVVGRVAKRVVEPLYGQAVLISGIDRPVIEGSEVAPFGAHSNALAAVVLVRHVSAAAVHVLPAPVQARASLAMRGDAGFESGTGRAASARKTLPASQVRAASDRLISAGARTAPKRPSARIIAGLGDHGPAAKGPAGQVNQSRIFRHA